jgi:hypothetical protein
VNPRFDALLVAVVLSLVLGLVTVTYLTIFNPPFIPPVSCTAATGCNTPDRPLPPAGPENPIYDG